MRNLRPDRRLRAHRALGWSRRPPRSRQADRTSRGRRRVRASFELKELFPAKFQSVARAGAAIYLRLQIELWEDRPVLDKLAQPAVITVFRIVLDPTTRQVRSADKYGEVIRQPALAGAADTGQISGARIALRQREYYVRAMATLAGIDRRVGNGRRPVRPRFGDDDRTVAWRRWGRCCFTPCLQANDYLQSVSSETRSRGLPGREVKAGLKIQ